eukprot:6547438-Prymnesium_polylepis.1
MVRAKAAHHHAVENLAPFVTVFFATKIIVSGDRDTEATIYMLTKVWLCSSIGHFPAMVSNVPMLRTLCFLGTTIAALAIAYFGIMADSPPAY